MPSRRTLQGGCGAEFAKESQFFLKIIEKRFQRGAKTARPGMPKSEGFIDFFRVLEYNNHVGVLIFDIQTGYE